MKSLLRSIALVMVFPLIILIALIIPKRRREMIWGPVPLMNNKYWSAAVKSLGYPSKTLMITFYPINQQSDFDLYFHDLVPKWGGFSRFLRFFSSYFAFLYIIRNAAVVHIPFSGSALGNTPLWRAEAFLFKWADIKTVVIPYGADAYIYSAVCDFSLRHGLLTNYPQAAKDEARIRAQVAYWTRHATIVIAGMMMEGIGRWDVLTKSPFVIDETLWQAKHSYSRADGKSSVVRVLHTPNHRGFKGTEFLIQAVEELQAEGLHVELVMLERVPNTRVREVMQEVDILADQFIATGYALGAIEGMASGLPVMANLEGEYLRVFRRYAFLNECPILSTTVETLKANLRVLVTDPTLREQLGRAGRAYVEKYHSFTCAQYMFGAIYDRIVHGKEVDLINLFHPLKSTYNRRLPLVQHPLVDSRLPS